VHLETCFDDGICEIECVFLLSSIFVGKLDYFIERRFLV